MSRAIYKVTVSCLNQSRELYWAMFDSEENAAKAAFRHLSHLAQHYAECPFFQDIFVRVVEYRQSSLDGRFLFVHAYDWV